jgi:hypothetical protein
MRSIAGLLIVAAFAVPALAADSAAPSGRGAAVRAACKADIETLCKGVEAGGGKIRRCLRDNRDKLSEGCKSAIAAARAARQQEKAAGGQTPAPN